MKCSECGREVGEGVKEKYYVINCKYYSYDIFQKEYGWKEIKEVKVLCKTCYNRIFKKKE